MNKLVAAVAAGLMIVAGLTTAQAGPTPGGLASDNVDFVTFVPFEGPTTTGARVIGKHLYVTSWKHFSIYDISKPEAPALLSTTPFARGFDVIKYNGKF